jgi:hypothetical protein
MKSLSLIIGALALTLLMGCEPQDRRPGTWTSGDIVDEKITDWSFSNEAQEVFIQTSPWYGIPHSVTTVLATRNQKLYVPSIYFDPNTPFPEGKYWNRIIADNPEVLVKIGGKRYPRRVVQVTDAKEFESGFLALAKKYPFWQEQYDNPEDRVTFYVLRLDETQAD